MNVCLNLNIIRPTHLVLSLINVCLNLEITRLDLYLMDNIGLRVLIYLEVAG